MKKQSNARGAKTALTKDTLDALLKYDENEGYFIRRSTRGGHRVGTIAGSVHKHVGYTEVCVNGVNYYAHRLAHLTMTGEWPAQQMDHINHIRTDNRWSNLRPASPALNNLNKPGWSSSGYKCIVTYDTKAFGTRYRVKITRDGEAIQETFADLDQAVAFRDAIIRERDGEFANTRHRDDI